MNSKTNNKPEELLALLKSKFSGHLLESSSSFGDVAIRISREYSLDFFRLLKLDAELSFDFFTSLTVVDYLDTSFMPRAEQERFDVVYHLRSLKKGYFLRIKIAVPETKPEIASLVELWPGANFMEREAWDMFGVIFVGNSDLRRILMYDEFIGYPLRKDYPVQKKQPRIPLRAPEVHNTARDMHRPSLVQIKSRYTDPKKCHDSKSCQSAGQGNRSSAGL